MTTTTTPTVSYFSDLNLPPFLLEGIKKLGYRHASRIQAASIPEAMRGSDIVGLAQTGSGKTAAFGLPLLAKIDTSLNAPQAIILCPTRELAQQVGRDIQSLGEFLPRLNTLSIYGGSPISRQLSTLHQGVHVVIGTPGRILDHLRRGSLDTSQIDTVVLDEADRMLDMGFRKDMETLLAEMPKQRQTLFFSATMNKQVEKLIQRFSRNAVFIEPEQKARTVATIDQCAYTVRSGSKIDMISRLLDFDTARLTIIFCNTKRAVDTCTEILASRGCVVDRLHGDITQQMRERVLKRFRAGNIEVLVATDVAARGLDIDEVDLVINYDLPQDSEDYVHRIGRTGRAGRSGRAVSLITKRDRRRLESIEKYTRQKIRHDKMPSREQVEALRIDRIFNQLEERLSSADFPPCEDRFVDLLGQGFTAPEIVSALVAMLNKDSGGRMEEDFDDAAELREEQKTEYKGNRRKNPAKQQTARQKQGGNKKSDASMVPLICSLGRRSGVKVKDLLGMLYGEFSLPAGAIGRIKLFEKNSRIDVEAAIADDLIALAPQLSLLGKRFTLKHDSLPRKKRQ